MADDLDPTKFFNWDEKIYFNKQGNTVIHGYCINTSKMSAKQLDDLRNDLTRAGVNFKEGKASVSTNTIKAGDMNLSVRSKDDIFNLFAGYFQFAMQFSKEELEQRGKDGYFYYGGKLIEEPLSEYEKKLAREQRQETEQGERSQLIEQECKNLENAYGGDDAAFKNMFVKYAMFAMKNPKTRAQIFSILSEAKADQILETTRVAHLRGNQNG